MDVLNLTKITIAWEMYESGIAKAHTASKLGINRESVHIWIKEIIAVGLLEFLDQYTKAKKGERSKRKIGVLSYQETSYEFKQEDTREVFKRTNVGYLSVHTAGQYDSSKMLPKLIHCLI